ncbi:uncharacterized protein KD926_001398 [Aspergillus affinis]|uniref:uncharacterized protein n=1 Tax=Aspergillus affinis TaxID=1070780 RepID=UPI0022FF3175|nr:uncharacterized protein KD926_001398 [Aspergillus affinis]KAI9036704.1 hypothetical protein KD926_001398 [Aspergillus affinis]
MLVASLFVAAKDVGGIGNAVGNAMIVAMEDANEEGVATVEEDVIMTVIVNDGMGPAITADEESAVEGETRAHS